MKPSEPFLFLKNRAKNKLLFGEFATFDTGSLLYNISFDRDDIRDMIHKKQRIYITPTIMHEKVHWFQHIGSSIGFLKSLIYTSQFNILSEFISNIKLESPLFDFFENKRDYINTTMAKKHTHLRFRTVDEPERELEAADVDFVGSILLNWFYFEYITILIEGDLTKDEVLKMSKTKRSLIKNQTINTSLIECLSHMYFFAYNYYLNMGLKSRNFRDWMTEFRRNPEISKFFQIDIGDGHSFGAKHIFEGQARYTDVVKIAETFLRAKMGREKDLSNFIDNYLAEKPYSIPFNIFEKYVDLGGSDFRRWLFLIVCDISINPVIPPLFDSPNLYAQGIGLIFPHIRFGAVLQALKSLLNNKKILAIPETQVGKQKKFKNAKIVNIQTIEGYNVFINAIYYNIKKETGILTPIDVATEFIKIHESVNLDKAPDSDYFLFNMKMFYKSCKIRLKCPLFFVDPAFLESLDRELYLKYSDEIKPPFVGMRDKYYPTYDEDMYVPYSYISKLTAYKFIRDIAINKKADLSSIRKSFNISRNGISKFLNKTFNQNVDKFFFA